MTQQTIEEKRAYVRGYNRARSRAADRAWKAVQIAKAYRARLQDFATERQCHTCQRWTRGCDNCVWGKCAADFEFSAEGRMWAEVYIGERLNKSELHRAIITTEHFGCINWLPRHEPAA